MALTTSLKLPERVRTAMIIPTSPETYFNTQWKAKAAQLGAYDMLYHPPDYNPKAARSDRQEPKIIRQNIWDQVNVHRKLVYYYYILVNYYSNRDGVSFRINAYSRLLTGGKQRRGTRGKLV